MSEPSLKTFGVRQQNPEEDKDDQQGNSKK
jgi:hypothetical protein